MYTAQVFRSGNSQAIRIPKELSIDQDELYVQKIGSSLLLTPKKELWSSFEESLDAFTEDLFAGGRAQPEGPEERTSL